MPQEIITQNKTIFIDHQNVYEEFDQGQNVMVYSKLGEGSYPTLNSGLSIKLVLSGSEKYRIGNKIHSLTPGKFLVVNKGKDLDCIIDHKNVAVGICIFLSPVMVQDVHHVLSKPCEELLNADLLHTQKNEFYENVFSFQSYQLGNLLENVGKKLTGKGKNIVVSDELFYNLAEQLIISQNEISGHIQKIETVKNSTKQELFRRLFIAKELIDSNPGEKLDINSISRQAALSEFHFIRMFRQVFGFSPYQYQLKKRLNKAKQLLSSNCFTVSEVAVHTGFADVFSLSKAFKKEFGCSPSQIFRN